MCYSNVLKYVKDTKQYEAHHKNQLTLDSAFHAAVSSIKTQSIRPRTRKLQRRLSCTQRYWLYEHLWRRNWQTEILRMLGGPTTIISPSQRTSHEKSIDIQIQNKRTWRSEISQPSIEIRSQMILSSPRSTILRQLRSSSFLHNDTSTICTHKYPQLEIAAIWRVYRFHSKQTRFKSSTCFLLMCRRIRRSTQIWLSPSPSCIRHERQSLRTGSALASVCTDFGLTCLKSDEYVFVKIVNNSNSRIQNIQPNSANFVEATAFVPKNDRIYSDCPHATAILITISYTNDNLAFTNCAALAAEFEVYCKVKFPMPRDPSTGIYPSNMTVIQQQAQCQLTSTSTSTNSLTNGAWNSATHCLHYFHKRPMISSKNSQNR